MRVQNRTWLKRKLVKIQLLESYGIERTNESIARKFGIPLDDVVKLNYNENFFMPKEKLTELMKEVADECDLRIYPQEEEYELKEKLSNYLNVPKDTVIVGNGGDELIERIAQLFLEKKDEALSITPTFSFYKYCTSHLGAKNFEIPLKKDFALDIEQISALITPSTRLLYLCSPNNPTANQFEIGEIRMLVEDFPGIVIVDEAYVEYAEYSVTSLAEKFENLIVLRTFSKAFGLAGLRLGYGTADQDLAKLLTEKAPLPYPVSSVALRIGSKLLENIDTVKKAIKQLKSERAALIKKLNGIDGVKAFDSKTNFVLFQTEKPHAEVYENLLSQGIIVKRLGKILHLENCLRTTVGLPQMNNRLLTALKGNCG